MVGFLNFASLSHWSNPSPLVGTESVGLVQGTASRPSSDSHSDMYCSGENPRSCPASPLRSFSLWASSSSLSIGFLLHPSGIFADLPLRLRILDPSPMISEIHLNVFTSMSGNVCCLVTFW